MGEEWIVFSGDEFSIDLRIKGTRVWAKKGSKPLFPCQTRKGEVKIFGALNNRTGKVMILKSERIDRFSFKKFLVKILHYHKKVYLIVDNAPWHKARDIKEFVNKNKYRLKIDYFPAYSPEYNPSEQCWRSVRKDLVTTKLFLSAESMGEQIQWYFKKKSFSSLKLERFLSP